MTRAHKYVTDTQIINLITLTEGQNEVLSIAVLHYFKYKLIKWSFSSQEFHICGKNSPN